jgi:uncharacterized protein YdeI (BOF family)
MTKAIWVLGAVIVVGIGIVAGVIFAGGNEPQAVAVTAAKGSGLDTVATSPAVAQVVNTPAPIQVAETVQNNNHPAADTAADFGPMVVDSLDELFANAATYSNKAVVVRGTIVTQCISGCTFSLEDGTGVIGVELIDDALDHVLDGGSIGRLVEVRGTVEVSPHLVIVIEDPEDWNYLD